MSVAATSVSAPQCHANAPPTRSRWFGDFYILDDNVHFKETTEYVLVLFVQISIVHAPSTEQVTLSFSSPEAVVSAN